MEEMEQDDESDWEIEEEKVLVTEEMADAMIQFVQPEASGGPEISGVCADKSKKFQSREVYVSLESAGLTKLPPVTGVFLSYHESSSQWHSAYPHANGVGRFHRAPTWGEGLRTERQALLLVLQFLWAKHFQRTGQGESHLAALDAAMQDSA